MSKIINITTIIVLLGFSLITLNSCSKTDARKVSPDPRERVKKNLEEGRGFRLMDTVGGKGKGGDFMFASANELWRASLDTIDFMPLALANYSGGIVITDWYSENGSPNESVKISVRFLSNEIRSDALYINVFLKKCSQNLTNCSISKNNNDIVADLNLNILKKATKYNRDIIEKNKPSLIVEAGSGVSTLIASYSLKKYGGGKISIIL